MLVEELKKINQSENEAAEIRKKAKADAKKILEHARQKTARTVDESESRANDIRLTLIEEGNQAADSQYQEYLQQTRETCSGMIDKARQCEEKAVAFIAERIVESSVNH